MRGGLQFGWVLAVKARKLRRDAPDAVVELLAVDFEPGEAPGGASCFSFAGGGDLRLRGRVRRRGAGRRLRALADARRTPHARRS